MTYRNVSIVFGPTLMFKPGASEEMLSNMNAGYTIVQLLCQHVCLDDILIYSPLLLIDTVLCV